MIKRNGRLGIVEKVSEAIRQSNFNGVLITGSDNVRYLCGTDFTFFFGTCGIQPVIFWPKMGKPVLFCASEVKDSFINRSWIDNVATVDLPAGGSSTHLLRIKKLIRNTVTSAGKGPVGVDMDRIPYSLFETFSGMAEEIELVDCSLWLKTLHMIKTNEEIALLEDIAYRTDHGILGAAHHVLSTVPRPGKGLAPKFYGYTAWKGNSMQQDTTPSPREAPASMPDIFGLWYRTSEQGVESP